MSIWVTYAWADERARGPCTNERAHNAKIKLDEVLDEVCERLLPILGLLAVDIDPLNRPAFKTAERDMPRAGNHVGGHVGRRRTVRPKRVCTCATDGSVKEDDLIIERWG